MRWGLNAPGEEQYDEDDDKETCTSADIMIAGTETVATTADKQHNEKDKEKIHGWMMCECLRMNRGLERKRTSDKNKSSLCSMGAAWQDPHLPQTGKGDSALRGVT